MGILELHHRSRTRHLVSPVRVPTDGINGGPLSRRSLGPPELHHLPQLNVLGARIADELAGTLFLEAETPGCVAVMVLPAAIRAPGRVEGSSEAVTVTPFPSP